MWKRIGVIVVWVLATLGTASITLAAVSKVGGEVSDRPAIPVSAQDLVVASAPSAAPDPVTPVSAGGSSTTTTIDWVTLTPATSAPIETAATTSTVTVPASSSPASSPTTVAAPTPPPSSAPVTTVLFGGSVTVQQSGGSLILISAVPASGFTADVESGGPAEVQVEFKSPSHESKYAAHVEGGSLSVSTEESGEDD